MAHSSLENKKMAILQFMTTSDSYIWNVKKSKGFLVGSKIFKKIFAGLNFEDCDSLRILSKHMARGSLG